MNGNDSTRVTQNVPSTGGWNTTGTIIYEVVLQAGINIIRFYNANTSGNTYAPPVDKISVPANPSPAISASGTLAAVNTIFPYASPSPTSFNVAGTNLTTGITVTAPTRFEVSTVVNGTYASTATIAGSGTISSTQVFVRLAANTPIGIYSGNLVLSSSGATNVNVATVSSSVTPWTYSFGSGGNTNSFNYNGTTMPNLVVSALTKNGVTSSSSTNNFFASAWGTGSVDNGAAGGTLDSSKYFQFTITAGQGFTVTNPSITFGVGRGNTGPRRFEWRSSLDNYATAIPVTTRSSSTGSGNVLQMTDSTTSRTGNTVSLTTSGQSQITFRFYAYGAESTSGTNSVGGLAGNLTFSGTLVEIPASPIITANGTLTAVNTTYGTASTTPTSFTVSGADMTEGIKVTPPSGFEVSTSSTFASGVGNSASPITIGSTGTIAQTTVYVRLAASAPVASSPFSGNIVLSSAGAASVNVATVSSTVNKATPTITTAPTASAITFGQTLASSTLSGGAASTPGSFAFTTPTTAPNAGTASQGVTFTPTDSSNFNTVTTSVNVTVNRATPTISTAPSASAITFGQTLASSTLSGGAASTGGTFAFTTPATAPNAGTASQGVTFTPSNTTNFNTVTTTVNVTVNKATPTITTAPSASAITFGQTLASSTLSGGSASTTGAFAFTTPATAPNAGTASQGVTFTPTNTSNFNTATTTVSVAVSQLPLTITAAAASKAAGAADPTLTYSSSGLLAGGSITGSLARASGETAGVYPITQGTLSAGGNYSISFTGANFVITGLRAVADSIQKPSDGSALKIPVASLLANDGSLNASGEIVAEPNLTVTAAQTSLGAALTIRGQFILFLPTTNGVETFTYTVSNGTATSTATVTLTGDASAPSFSLELIKRGTAASSGGSTSVTHDFLGVPNQTYRIQYSTNLSNWTTAPDQSSGSTGSFSVTFTQSGDHAASWNNQMFFRATKP
jgi:hypothetical protein